MNQFPIQLAKVQRPPLREETLQRDRLLDWLHAKIHNRIVLVTAEAGYGKTTLLADFSRRTRLRTLWYRLDYEDRNWVSFLNYLVVAGRQVEPGVASVTASLLSELSGTGGPTRDAIIETFLRELQALGDAGAVLIIDDYHIVDDVPDIRLFMRELIARAPERLTLVIVSRHAPNLPLARLRALGELVELTRADLHFDRHETDRLFREVYGRPLERDVLADLERRVEGWPASLQLVQAALRNRSSTEVRTFIRNLTGAHEEIYDYLAEEVVGDLDDETQQFLMRTSILEAVNPSLALIVTGEVKDRAVSLIDLGEKRGLLTRRGAGSRDHRYHPLIRSFLEARLRREIGDDATADLHRAVARYGEGRDWRLSSHHYSVAGDVDDLHRVVNDAIHTIMANGDFAVASSYVTEFPPTTHNPIFDLFESRMDLHGGRIELGRKRARSAFEALGDVGPASDLALSNLISLEYMSGELEEASLLVNKLREQTSDPTLAAMANANRLLLDASVDGDIETLIREFDSLAVLFAKLGHLRYLGIARLNTAFAHRARGEAVEALDDASVAIDALSKTTADLEITDARLTRGWALAHLRRWEEAVGELATALETTHPLAHLEALTDSADTYGRYSDPVTAQLFLDEASQQKQLSPGHKDRLLLTLAENSIRTLRLDDATQYIAETRSDAFADYTAHKARKLVLQAYLCTLRNDDGARDVAQKALDHADRQGATLWASVARILVAWQQSQGQWSAAIEGIGRHDPAVLSIVAELISARLHDLEPPALRLVTAEAAARNDRWRHSLRLAIKSGTPDVKRSAGLLLESVGSAEDVVLLRTLAKSLKGSHAAPNLGRALARSLADRVFVEDQGRVSIRIGTRLVAGTEVRRKVLSLLCYLLTRPALSATKDQVLEALWPDLEPVVAVNSLNQTVYFLRRVFEAKYSETLSPGYLHHASDVLWLDQELVSSRSIGCWDILKGLGGTPSHEDLTALGKAYIGRFALDFAYEEWAASYRDTLHAAYLEVMENAVTADTNNGHFGRAIQLARCALDVDREADQIEVALLRLYRMTGAHSAAAEQYAHYADMMRNELGLEPPALESL